MEWGTFITVIAAIYLAWYGLNFLYDLFISGKPKVETAGGIHYNISDLMAEEEKPYTVSPKDFEDKTVDVHEPEATAPKASAPADVPAAAGASQNIGQPSAPIEAEPQLPVSQAQTEAEDWASVIDQEEEKIDIPVQGQPIAVNDFILALKEQAKAETSSITF